MPYVNGVFVRLRSWIADRAAGLNIQPDLLDQDTDDIARALSLAVTRDGQGAPTADISWGNNKITNLKDATSPKDAVNLETLTTYAADGGVLLSVSGTMSLLAAPVNGGAIVINGQPQTIPAGGVTLATPAVSVSTLYYVYLYMSADTVPVMKMEVSTTAASVDATGRRNKAGDATRRLIGMVATNGTGLFSDTLQFRGCLNFFNRRNRAIMTSVGNQAVYSVAPVIVAPSVSFLAWGDEDVTFGLGGTGNGAAGTGVVLNALVYVDNVRIGTGASVSCDNTYGAVATLAPVTLAEGLHTLDVRCYVTAGNATVSLAASGSLRG